MPKSRVTNNKASPDVSDEALSLFELGANNGGSLALFFIKLGGIAGHHRAFNHRGIALLV